MSVFGSCGKKVLVQIHMYCYRRYVDKIDSNTILLLSSIPCHLIGTMGRCQVMGRCHVLLRVQYSCGGVLVFWLQWEIVFGVLHILSVQYSCAVVSVFGCSGK